jgi:hypothetical protein
MAAVAEDHWDRVAISPGRDRTHPCRTLRLSPYPPGVGQVREVLSWRKQQLSREAGILVVTCCSKMTPLIISSRLMTPIWLLTDI